MSQSQVVFLPLGGTGEIGMNCNLYGAARDAAGKQYDWIMVDLGVSFDKGDTPGIDLIMPDIQFIAEQRENLHALLLTHGHEDHIGAVARLWQHLGCPIYATPFTAALVRSKLAEAGLDNAPLHIIDTNAQIKIASFTIDYITLTHSIPEPSALAIRCGDTRILHTGDWKIDPAPVIGDLTQETRLKDFGNENIDAIICDSTNALVAGRSGSEGAVAENLRTTIAQCQRRVVVTSFASNVARLTSIAEAAMACGRHLCLSGRGMYKVVAAARESGYLKTLPSLIDESDAATIPPEKLLIICTGSQGEERAALARIAFGRHPYLKLEEGDSVIFSSRVIPGNELSILAIQNQLVNTGIAVITPQGHDLHVSGHPCRDELKDMYGWARPRVAIPVHGEARHLAAHADLARTLGVAQAMQIENGDMVQITPHPARVIDRVPNGRLYSDGRVLVTADDEAIATRRKLAMAGLVVVNLPIDAADHLSGVIDITTLGIPEAENLQEQLLDAVHRAIPANGKLTPQHAERAIRTHITRLMKAQWGKKPAIEVRFVRCL